MDDISQMYTDTVKIFKKFFKSIFLVLLITLLFRYIIYDIIQYSETISRIVYIFILLYFLYNTASLIFFSILSLLYMWGKETYSEVDYKLVLKSSIKKVRPVILTTILILWIALIPIASWWVLKVGEIELGRLWSLVYVLFFIVATVSFLLYTQFGIAETIFEKDISWIKAIKNSISLVKKNWRKKLFKYSAYIYIWIAVIERLILWGANLLAVFSSELWIVLAIVIPHITLIFAVILYTVMYVSYKFNKIETPQWT